MDDFDRMARAEKAVFVSKNRKAVERSASEPGASRLVLESDKKFGGVLSDWVVHELDDSSRKFCEKMYDGSVMPFFVCGKLSGDTSGMREDGGNIYTSIVFNFYTSFLLLETVCSVYALQGPGDIIKEASFFSINTRKTLSDNLANRRLEEKKKKAEIVEFPGRKSD